MPVKKIAVLVSGGGTNLQSLIDSIHGREGEISLVISDTPGVYALSRAKAAGILAETLDYKNFEDKNDFYDALYQRLDQEAPALIVLAGFLKILPERFYQRFPLQIINIHPALIPSFCGKGYYGIKVHEAALEYGVKVTGVTVHFADGGADTGPIILQRAVEVMDEDTPEILQKRVLAVEHQILPDAVRLFLTDRLEICGRRVKIK